MKSLYEIVLPKSAVSFDAQAFDEAIRDHGVPFIHFRSMRCPVGLTDRYDASRPHDDHAGCSNGFVYTEAGTVTCLFLGNSKSTDPSEVGFLGQAQVQVSFPRTYDNPPEEAVSVAPFDRLYLADPNILVPNWQTFDANIIGMDRMAFPVAKVYDLIDSSYRRYVQGQDFEIVDGQIKWIDGRTPGIDIVTGKGKVCSIRYGYRPYFYIKHLLHEVRVAQARDEISGQRVLLRMPQAAVIQREYVFENEDRDSQALDAASLRQIKEPGSGSFGPR